ncbi:MFS transporter [Undibacterium seohonense]|jgi:EmrB/QacA subfamily drug resistance transporter|uniref:MFS transporter n=1 Tax=Undibacterium seohonense TaxID=1344950 RepID=A0ABR6WZT1_9BURK|nr:MFS transporter [Undibacterium seohonense]MBC3806194.1 MFS transporter [Undibacterium seohonense]
MKAENLKTKLALAALSLSALLSSLSTSSANVALPELARSFDVSMQVVQWVVLAYLLAITTLIVSVGRLGDLFGRRRLLLTGLFVFTMASSLCAIASDIYVLIAARALQGSGAATMMALAMALVTETVAEDQTGSAMGLLGSMSAIGTALGPTIGGSLIFGLGWPSIFYINLPLGLLTGVLAYYYLPADPTRKPKQAIRFDVVGTLLLSCCLAAYALAMTLGHGSFHGLNAAILLVSMIGLGIFLRHQSKADAPLIPLSLFRNRHHNRTRSHSLSSGFIMSGLVTTVVMASLVVGPFYLAGIYHLSAVNIGFVMSSGPMVAALTGLPAGRLVDRYGAATMCTAGLMIMGIGSASLTAFAGNFGLASYIAPLVSITAGYALFQTANNTAVMHSVDAGQRGIISGMLNLARNLGLITGASFMATIFTAASTNHTPTPDLIVGLQMTFAVATALIMLALFIALCSRMQRHEQQSQTELGQ